MLRNQTIHIYVPFDNIRDYIIAADAAATIIAAVGAINEKAGVYTKIIASEKPTSIAEIIAICKKIARHTPRIVISASELSAIYRRRIQFHSIAIPINEQISRTNLIVGIAQVMAAELISLERSG